MVFSDDVVWKVWAKAMVVGGNDALLWRKDECGAWIVRSHYGNRNSEYGWEIDHIKPISDGGTDEISNLRPLQWQNNLRKSDGTLDCRIVAESDHNANVS